MRKLLLILLVFCGTQIFAQTELGLSREEILKLPWVVEYHKAHEYLPALEYDFMRVKADKYHYTFGFSNLGLCNSLTLESRSFTGDIRLRDFLGLNGVPLSAATYLINAGDKKNQHYAFVIATHKGLPHQVVFSYRQMFKTDATSRVDTYPYEINDN